MTKTIKKIIRYCPDCSERVIPTNTRKNIFFCEKCESIYTIDEVKKKK